MANDAGSGADQINVGEVGVIGSILGAVTIDGEGGFDTLKVLADFFDPALVALERLELGNATLTLNTAAASFEEINQTAGTLTGMASGNGKFGSEISVILALAADILPGVSIRTLFSVSASGGWPA